MIELDENFVGSWEFVNSIKKDSKDFLNEQILSYIIFVL